MLWTGSNLSISSGKRTHEWAVKSWGAEETKSSHFFSAPCSRLSFRLSLARDFSRYSLMAQSIPSVPIPPKASVMCWHLLLLSTSAQERAKFLKLSSVAKPVNSTQFAKLISNYRKKSLRFLVKKPQPSSERKSTPVLFQKLLKMLFCIMLL